MLQRWLRLHGGSLLLMIGAIGFVVLIAATRNRYLSPDEALHFELVKSPGLLDVYRNSRSNSHPPLFFLLLHLWIGFGRTELWLRLLPAILGFAFLWSLWRWGGCLSGKAAGFFALLAAAFSPACLPLSMEVRNYSLLLLLSALALLQFERAVEDRSTLGMAAFSVVLYLAILAHYSALFLTASLFVYAPIRFWSRRSPPRLVAAWAASQAGAAALYAFLYRTHLAHIRGGEMEREAITNWLHAGYFQPGRESPAAFMVRQTRDLFLYFFGSPVAAGVAFVLAAAGVAVLGLRRRPSAVLLVLPFLFGIGGALLDLYPFGGTRHCIYLLPFAAIAIGTAASTIVAGRPARALILALALAFLFWRPVVWSAPQGSLPAMNAAIEQIRRSVPEGSVLFSDSRFGSVLAYYLGRDGQGTRRLGSGDFWQSDVGGYCLVSSLAWDPSPKLFAEELERFLSVSRWPGGEPLWAAHLGYTGNPTGELARRFDGAIRISRVGGVFLIQVWPGERVETTSATLPYRPS